MDHNNAPPSPLPWLLASGWIWPKGSTTRRSKGKENEVGVFVAPHDGVLLSRSVHSGSGVPLSHEFPETSCYYSYALFSLFKLIPAGIQSLTTKQVLSTMPSHRQTLCSL